MEREHGDPSPAQPGEFSRLLEDLARPATASATDRAWEEMVSVAPERLGRFRILRTLGRGGFGVVYEAEDPELGRHVAIKVLQRRREEGAWNEMLKREAEAVARLSHPAIVTLHDFGHADGQVFLVYELLQGESLRNLMRRGPLPGAECVRILRAVAAALGHAHREGVVHRDLTPGNVFLLRDGSVKVLDFGLSLVEGAAGLPAGTPPYAAPEQWRGEAVNSRADVHAWGVLAAELLAGHPPGESGPPPGWFARRGPLASLVRSACAVDPARRPADGGALLDALERIARRRRRMAAGLAALAVVAVLLAAGYDRLRPRAPSPAPGPFRLAVADAENDTGDSALDGAGTLLAKLLEGNESLEILDHGRMAGVLRASGRAVGERIDAESADLAAQQVGADAVLIPRVSREGGGFLLTAIARSPGTHRPQFEVKERFADSASLMDSAGRLAQVARRELHSRAPQIRSPEEEQARTVTKSTEAFRHYNDGILCLERPARGAGSWVRPDCSRHFEAALAVDPEFPLAHLELVREAYWNSEPSDRMLAMLEPALRRADRLSPKDRAELLAWKYFLEGDVDRATDQLAEAGRKFPGDARVALASGDLLFRAGRYDAAADSLRRAWDLDPAMDYALETVVWTLGVLDRRDELEKLVDRLAQVSPSPGILHAEVQARGWLGQHEAAIELARRAAVGGDRPAREDLVDALVAAGRLDEAEHLARSIDPDGQGRRRLTGILLELQGRRREAAAYLDPPLPADAGAVERVTRGYRRAIQLAATRDAASIRRIVEESLRDSPEKAADLAPMLAYAGDVDGALALRKDFKENEASRLAVDALATWRRQGAGAALPALRRLLRGDPQVPTVGPPETLSWLVAECSAEAIGGETALADLRRFQRFYFPLGAWRAWAYPRSLVMEARILAGLGRREEARAALDRFDRLWRRADPGQPLLAEARALRREVDGARGGGRR